MDSRLLKRVTRFNKSMIGKSFYYVPQVIIDPELMKGASVVLLEKHDGPAVTVKMHWGNTKEYVVLITDLTYNL